MAEVLAAVDLPRHCAGEPALTETVLRSLCFHLDMIVDYMDRGDGAEAAATLALDAFAADWKERCGTMDELTAIFGEYADLVKNTRWDMMRGLLRSGGWQEVVRARRLIEALPELARIVRQLGRARETDEPDASNRSDVRIMEEHLAMRQVERIVQVPDYPGETLGVRRSGRVARMLPAEAMLLLHPRLRLVWHARHAERTLLSYEDDDRMPEMTQRTGAGLAPEFAPRAEQAPGDGPDAGLRRHLGFDAGRRRGRGQGRGAGSRAHRARAAARLPPVRVFRAGGDRRNRTRRRLRRASRASPNSWARPSAAAPTSPGRWSGRWPSSTSATGNWPTC